MTVYRLNVWMAVQFSKTPPKSSLCLRGEVLPMEKQNAEAQHRHADFTDCFIVDIIQVNARDFSTESARKWCNGNTAERIIFEFD